MYLAELIEVAIGLILVFIVMSLTVLQIQEWFSGLLSKRAKDLELILRNMLAETSSTQASDANNLLLPQTDALEGNILKRIYKHPLIRSLSRGGKKPSYIPAQKFVTAFLDTIMTAGTDASTIQQTLEELKSSLPEAVLEEIESNTNVLITTAMEAMEYPERLEELRKAIEKLADKFPDYKLEERFEALLLAHLPKDEAEVLRLLKMGSSNLIIQNPELRQTIDSLIAQAEIYVKKGESVLEKVRTNAEDWFNDTMDRASGWYKRNAQKWAFWIGLFLALFFNVDTIQIATELWRQPLLRQSLSAAAEDFQLPSTDISEPEDIANAQEAINQLRSTFSGLNIPIGWSLEPLGPQKYNSLSDRCTLFPNSRAGDTPGKDVFGLSINGQCKVWTNPPRGWGTITKLIGILVTALATVQGAPFWFEILKKIINIRSTGTKPEEKTKK